MTPKKLIRAMSARRSSTLSCGHYVLRGELIVKVGGRWMCTPCRLAQLRDLDRTMRETPRPSERSASPTNRRQDETPARPTAPHVPPARGSLRQRAATYTQQVGTTRDKPGQRA